jgi:hypothetical protein
LTERGGSLAVAELPDDGGTPPVQRVASKPVAGADEIACGAGGPGRLERAVAERRVERFLSGFGMPRGRRRERVIQNCVARAAARWRETPARELGALALEEAEEALSRWFTAVLEPEMIGEHPPLLVGRVAFEICDAAGSWPGVLATCDRLPPASLEALRQAGFAPTPAEEPGSMVEQPLDYWSAKELVSALRSLAVRFVLGGRAASVS